jgi:hypothetical protein
VGLDYRVLQLFPVFAEVVVDPRCRSLLMRHLISLARGHDREMWSEAVARDREDPVRGFLLMPPEATPGSAFAYSQPCTYSVAAVIQRRAGQRLSDYLVPRLLEPLGIDPVARFCMPPGREQGVSGLFARAEDVAKLGQLYLQRGRWEEQQLIPESYVAQATSPAVATADADADKVDWSQGYGYGFWMSRHGYRGDGAFGQFCLVLPEQDAVVAVTGSTEAMQAVLGHVWEHLLPSLGRGTEIAEDAQPRLVERLRALRLPTCPATPAPARWEDWSGTTFSVDSSASTLSSIAVETSGGSLDITLREADNALTFAAGTGEWLVSEPSDASGDDVPVAASAGWIDGDTLRVEVIFLETPHRMDVECSLSTGTARATWRGTPLDGGRLKRLHRPR